MGALKQLSAAFYEAFWQANGNFEETQRGKVTLLTISLYISCFEVPKH